MGAVKKKITIEIKKKKRRVPLPAKPPKVIRSKKFYDRKNEKDKLRKKKNEE